ncbi:leucyl-tRNA synthetase [Intrasporangium oryzae NRRL B-24470]|uniref:Leucine--tRNA ligase n=1 Tax=Intrasporangium oryzae NRRL B-24470 TaxID=1386089 RepID=W9GE89_9MICO|nr:leucine--tRNA ligase [Intrasporangium oryzae]EWT03143.1 leucyl-tRNA synthetase [Intrasporangium oryzae NRRL B-24470]
MSQAPITPSTPTASANETPFRYTAAMARDIEIAWQDRWEEEGTFNAPNPAGPWAEPEKVGALGQKLLVLDMFPYPSGVGLHVGHPLGYIATDVYSRFHRMLGKNVLHALGYDAFGLPAEQYAVQTGQHPRKTTEENMTNMRRQLRRLGLGFDNRRTFATIDEDYYRWTQWIFLQIWDAWYDADAVRADGAKGRARPISELVAELESGERAIPDGDGRAWADLGSTEQAKVLDGFRLAYTDEAPVNWCPGLGTVLSNEEVTNEGRSERGNYPVFRRNLSQWKMRITAYADRLADDLDGVDWPEKVKLMQRNWIGRSHGARVTFPVVLGTGETGGIEVFTTRPDTIFGATFMVIAPEHPLVDSLVPEGAWPEGTHDDWKGQHAAASATPKEAVAAYRLAASRKSEVERQTEGKDKTGVFTGSFATNPLTGQSIPVFVADYVLMGYGTGAIMAVPGHDERDFEYASKFSIPIVRVVAPTAEQADMPLTEWFVGDGVAVNSANDAVSLDGLGIDDAKARIIAHLEAGGIGHGTINYRIRDWLFSRQRYWGEPFPIMYDEDGVAYAVPEEQLPLTLPDVPDYSPKTFDPDDAQSSPEPPLSRVPEWVNVEMDLGDGRGLRRFRRETNTMPNWAGSCWYYLRYLDPANHDALVDPENERYWMARHAEPVAGAPAGTRDPGGVDLYVGGVEHAVLHLLYARFWHKVLFDLGHVSSEEPFRKYFSQGYIQAWAYTDSRGQYVPASEVREEPGKDGEPTFVWEGQLVNREYGKIGKSLKNSVSPDEMYDAYGADTFRVYEMSMGPLELSKPWEIRAVVGSQRFLQRLWRNVVDEETGAVRVADVSPDQALTTQLHQTIAGVREDYEGLRFNTAIAKLIELNNAVTKLDVPPREVVEALVLMLAPVAPHIAEEMWARLGHDGGVAYAAFPVSDPAKIVESQVTCVVQIKGKVRDRVDVAPDISEDELRELVLARDKVRAATANGIRTVIVRAPKLVNVVPL